MGHGHPAAFADPVLGQEADRHGKRCRHRRHILSQPGPRHIGGLVCGAFGVDPLPGDYGTTPWQSAGGTVVCAPFPADTDYLDRREQGFMVNFRVRVRDLDRMVAQLETAGIAVRRDPETYPEGRFARIHDPNGNPVELCAPAG